MSRAWRDGEWLAGEASAWVEESGLLTGDGLFETLRADDGQLRDPEAHLERLEQGLAELELRTPEAPAALLGVARQLAAAVPSPTARLRITVARRGGGRPPLRLVHGSPYTPPEPEEYRDGVAVITLRAPRLDARDPLAGVKSLSRGRHAWAARRARARGAFEALLLNVDGRLAEASRCNVLVRIDGRLTTPPVTEGCLPGTVRRRLLEVGGVEEAPVEGRRLGEVTELLLTNSLVGVLPASSLDGRRLEVTATAAELLEALPRPGTQGCGRT